MSKKLSRGSLLKGDGKTLCEVGYADKLLKAYSYKGIKGKGINKFEEGTSFIYYESGLCVALNVKRKRFYGITKVQVYDFVNRKFASSKVVEFMFAKKYGMNGGRELHIKNRELVLDFVDGKKKNLSYKFNGEDKISFNAEISNKMLLTSVTANQYKDGFSYVLNSLGFKLCGELKLNDMKYKMLGISNAICSVNSKVCTTKSITNGAKIFGSGNVFGKPFSIIIDTLSDENYVNSSTFIYDGYPYKLGDICSIIKSQNGYKYLSHDDELELEFSPHVLHFNNLKRNEGLEFGKLRGVIKLKNGELLNLENINAFIAYNGRIM